LKTGVALLLVADVGAAAVIIVLLSVATTDAAAPGAAITIVLLLAFAVGVLAIPMLELMDDEFCAFAP
jgi:hypothetical protein